MVRMNSSKRILFHCDEGSLSKIIFLKTSFFQDILSAIPELEISSCSLDTVPGGRGVRGGAKLVLSKPELLDSWPGEHPSIWVKNKEV